MRANYTGVSQANLPANRRGLSSGAGSGPTVDCRLRGGTATTVAVAQKMFASFNGTNASCGLCMEKHGRHLCQTAR